MCDYCGCRSIKPIGDLSAEHVLIQNLCGDVRRAVEGRDFAAAGQHLRDLVAVLHEHDAVEELSLYPAMARHPEYRDKVGTLFDEHDDLDSVLDEAVRRIDAGAADQVAWPAVVAEFETLKEHILHEENGLFPAAAIALESADWDQAEQVREDYRRSVHHGP